MAKDGWVHVNPGWGQYAPCGVKVVTSDFREEMQQSCADEFEMVTCRICRACVARMVRLYRKATRGKDKWKETF